MALRHALILGALLVLVALLVSSPHHVTFWVVLGVEMVALSGYVYGLTRLYRA